MHTIARTVSFLCATTLVAASTAIAQASWSVAWPPQSPPADWQWSAAFDELHGQALIHKFNQAWRWNGSTWTALPAPVPNIGSACMVYDVARQRVVLWGGGVGAAQQLWEWNGASWLQRSVAMPPGRVATAFAYDRARAMTVMFGGHDGFTQRDDTWEWNGTVWSNPSPAVRPAVREQAAMAFDPTTQRVLLYGGLGPNQFHNIDTWTWNGSTWQQHTPATPPYARDTASMVADLDRARVVLHGGSAYDYQTWEWDGAQWHASTPGSPGTLLFPAAFYDTVRREVVLHGGNSSIGMTNNTWRYRTPNAATIASFGAGCPGSAGVPSLTNAPYQLPWLGDTMRTQVTTPPASLGALFVSSFTPATPLGLAFLGMPGCTLLVTPDVLEFRAANAGAAQWALGIPNLPALVGVSIHQQALPLDPTANALGLVASQGIVMQPGIR